MTASATAIFRQRHPEEHSHQCVYALMAMRLEGWGHRRPSRRALQALLRMTVDITVVKQ
jgi:hypothetical protein